LKNYKKKSILFEQYITENKGDTKDSPEFVYRRTSFTGKTLNETFLKEEEP